MVSGAPTTIPAMAGPGIAGSQRLDNAWPMCAGLVGIADPVRTRLHCGHRLDIQGAKTLRLAQQLRQLGDMRRDPPRLAWYVEILIRALTKRD
jgi:hypothetical protein